MEKPLDSILFAMVFMGCVSAPPSADADGDGYAAVQDGGGDCDDANAAIGL